MTIVIFEYTLWRSRTPRANLPPVKVLVKVSPKGFTTLTIEHFAKKIPTSSGSV